MFAQKGIAKIHLILDIPILVRIVTVIQFRGSELNTLLYAATAAVGNSTLAGRSFKFIELGEKGFPANKVRQIISLSNTTLMKWNCI